MHQAVSPAETEVLTFSIDRLPESESISKAEDRPLPVLRLSPLLALSMVSLGLAVTFPQSPSLCNVNAFVFSLPQNSCFRMYFLEGQKEGGVSHFKRELDHNFLVRTILNATNSETA